MQISPGIMTMIVAVIPSLLSGLILFYIKKRDDRSARKEQEKERAQIGLYSILLRGLGVSLELGEATAIAIRDHKFNGELEAARENARVVQQDIQAFVIDQGARNLQRP